MSHIRMSHVTPMMNHALSTSAVRSPQVHTQMNESSHAYEWVMLYGEAQGVTTSSASNSVTFVFLTVPKINAIYWVASNQIDPSYMPSSCMVCEGLFYTLFHITSHPAWSLPFRLTGIFSKGAIFSYNFSLEWGPEKIVPVYIACITSDYHTVTGLSIHV